MLRTGIVFVAALAGVLLVQAVGAAEQPELKFGQKYDGEINNTTESSGGTLSGFKIQIPLTLKAGKDISLSVTVLGKDRTVGLLLRDPSNKVIGTSGAMKPKSVQVTVEEVSANGTYTIIIYSDRIGVFTLLATETKDELDEKMLQEKINRLEKELAELREKLKAKQDKKP